MNEEETDERIESTASGLEPVSMDATAALAEAEKRAKADAARSEPPSATLRSRVIRELRKLVGR